MRRRILVAMLVVTAFAMLGAGGASFLIQRSQVVADVDTRLTDRVAQARGALDALDLADPKTTTAQALATVLEGVDAGPHEGLLGVLNGKAAVTPNGEVDVHLEGDPAFVDRVLGEVADGSIRIGTASSTLGELRYIAAPVDINNSGRGIFVAAIDMDAELAQTKSGALASLWVGLGSLVIIGLVGWLVAGRVLDPIRRLRIATANINASDLRERIPVTGTDDLSLLTETINEMLERLDSALTSQRRLLDDVRHELKTPITIVRGHLELVDPTSPADVQSTRALAIEELDRMTGLVDDIASLAESQAAAPVRRNVDVAALTRSVFDKARVVPGHTWHLTDVANATISLDPSRITQAWLQLVDNAAKYSPAGSPITIGSTLGADTIEFWVNDVGPGIPAGAEDRVLQRFGRADAGRGIHGSGLGLAIVHAIVTAHGGRVAIVSSVFGSHIGLELPVRESAPIQTTAASPSLTEVGR